MNIILRPITFKDAAVLQLAANNRVLADSLRNSFPHPYTIIDAETYIVSVAGNLPETDFVIVADGEFAGKIAVDLMDDIYSTTAEIGYWIAETHWGNGIVTSAVKQIVNYIRQNFDRPRIVAMCAEHNKGSRSVLKKNGFVLESLRQKAAIKNGVIFNDCVYVLIF